MIERAGRSLPLISTLNVMRYGFGLVRDFRAMRETCSARTETDRSTRTASDAEMVVRFVTDAPDLSQIEEQLLPIILGVTGRTFKTIPYVDQPGGGNLGRLILPEHAYRLVANPSQDASFTDVAASWSAQCGEALSGRFACGLMFDERANRAYHILSYIEVRHQACCGRDRQYCLAVQLARHVDRDGFSLLG